MGVYHTYFDKNNTIVENSFVNTGKNPVTQLYYGQSLSRFLFYCSFNEIKQKFLNKEFTLANVKHYLKMKNCSNFDVTQKLSVGENLVFSGVYRASSFDMELRAMKEYWDEGVGFDFQPNLFSAVYPYDITYVTTPSNWYSGTTNKKFLTTGGTLSNSIISTQHFNSGDEDICMDITNFVNEILASGITTGITIGRVSTGTTTGITYNYQGFCLKFSEFFENLNNTNQTAVGFFTRYTQTFFDPYIETIYDDLIMDDRTDFYLNKINRLYFILDQYSQNVYSMRCCCLWTRVSNYRHLGWCLRSTMRLLVKRASPTTSTSPRLQLPMRLVATSPKTMVKMDQV